MTFIKETIGRYTLLTMSGLEGVSMLCIVPVGKILFYNFTILNINIT